MFKKCSLYSRLFLFIIFATQGQVIFAQSAETKSANCLGWQEQGNNAPLLREKLKSLSVYLPHSEIKEEKTAQAFYDGGDFVGHLERHGDILESSIFKKANEDTFPEDTPVTMNGMKFLKLKPKDSKPDSNTAYDELTSDELKSLKPYYGIRVTLDKKCQIRRIDTRFFRGPKDKNVITMAQFPEEEWETQWSYGFCRFDWFHHSLSVGEVTNLCNAQEWAGMLDITQKTKDLGAGKFQRLRESCTGDATSNYSQKVTIAGFEKPCHQENEAGPKIMNAAKPKGTTATKPSSKTSATPPKSPSPEVHPHSLGAPIAQ